MDIKSRIKTLFDQLLEEEKGRFQPGTNFQNRMDPDKDIYYQIAIELMDLAKHCLDISNDDKGMLNSIQGKELLYVRNHVCKYLPNSNLLTASNRDELQRKMLSASSEIRLALHSILG